MTITKIKKQYTQIQIFKSHSTYYVVVFKSGDISFPVQSCSDMKSARLIQNILVKAIQRIIEEANEKNI